MLSLTPMKKKAMGTSIIEIEDLQIKWKTNHHT
jgi:hypothetical protein